MAAEDVAKALMAMDDEALRSAVAGGDLSGLADLDLDLDEQEQALVVDAAGQGDVDGFIQDNVVRAGFLCDGLTSLQCNEMVVAWPAVAYARQGLQGQALASFNQWASIKGAQGGW